MNSHLDWSTLNAYADNELSADARAQAAQHLDSCTQCRGELERVRAVIGAASSAPSAIAPPESAWNAIRRTIDSGKIVELSRSQSRSAARSKLGLAAAAVLLVAVSSTVTVLITRQGESTTAIPVVATSNAAGAGESVTVTLARMERGYINTVNELTATLDQTRAKLAPETIKAVERSLKTIDDAIAEAREALLRDPASDVLRNVLSKNYEQKVDLLRRASAHASTTE